MAKCKKSQKRFDQINVIPFIDIMLVLLVMVLTTATFIKQGVIPVELPHAKGSQKEELKKRYLFMSMLWVRCFLKKKKLI